jgi:diguanylate cyclase (GGDEF)-like protein
MSFRTRLSLFFVLIVIVPMVSLTFVLFRLIADNENGKADAGVGARQATAVILFEEARVAAGRGAEALGRDPALATALQTGRVGEARQRAEALLRPLGLKRIVIGPEGGRPRVDVGSRSAVFPVSRRLQSATGRSFGAVQVSAQGPRAYVEEVKRVTGIDVVVRRDGRTLATTRPSAARVRLPAEGRGDVELDGRPFRVSSFRVTSFAGSRASVSVLSPSEAVSEDIRRSRLFAAGILLGFFVLAFTFAVLVSRSLQRQIGGFLVAARRLGSGDFSAKVPTEGRDEFAALGEEFNRMSAELEQRLEDLSAEQARLAGAMRRIGETFAANLDRDGLLEIVLRTALDGAGATGGRAGLRDAPEAPLRKVAEAGSLEGLELTIWAAEADALATDQPAEVDRDGVSALAHPLRSVKGEGSLTGVVSVARAGRPFSPAERDLFEYLARQAAVSIENVGLHETVERQAVTDELTGLANRRRFQETLLTEVERSRRFGSPLALVMIDIDDFKKVNDTHGHQMGDTVLREVGRIVRASSREVDTPARYGGEELAMLLPSTDLEGAFNLAERVRTEIGGLVLPLPGGGALRVTASFGAATHPESAGDARHLVEAADTALYEAKRSGKDRTVRAARVPSG